jgi:hypothetical protein
MKLEYLRVRSEFQSDENRCGQNINFLRDKSLFIAKHF